MRLSLAIIATLCMVSCARKEVRQVYTLPEKFTEQALNFREVSHMDSLGKIKAGEMRAFMIKIGEPEIEADSMEEYRLFFCRHIGTSGFIYHVIPLPDGTATLISSAIVAPMEGIDSFSHPWKNSVYNIKTQTLLEKRVQKLSKTQWSNFISLLKKSEYWKITDSHPSCIGDCYGFESQSRFFADTLTYSKIHVDCLEDGDFRQACRFLIQTSLVTRDHKFWK